MMICKKSIIAFMLVLLMAFLTAFSKQEPVAVKDVEINVMRIAGILRYDIVLGKLKLNNNEDGDSPGHYMFHHNGFNFAVRPNKALASLMELEPNTKFIKMQLRGSGSSGDFQKQDQTSLHLEYAIKKDTRIEDVRKYALDSTLIVLSGNKVITEISLNNMK